MSSGQHTPGRAPRLRDASRHNLPSILANDQQRTADVRPATYHGRIGKDRHLVRNQGSDIIYSVGGPSQSFKPGTIVFLGSNTGRPGESIIALPSPTQRGASGYPESRIRGSVQFPTPDEPPAPPPTCPEYTSYSYIGVYNKSTTDTLYAWNYTDGTPGSLIQSKAYNADLGTSNPSGPYYYLPSSSSIMFKATGGKVCTWNLTTNSLTVATAAGVVGATTMVGSTFYFMLSGSGSTKTLYSVAAGSSTVTTLNTLSDVSSGAGWWTYFGSVLIPLSSGIIVCGSRSEELGQEDYYFSDFLSDTPKKVSLGSNSLGGMSEAQELATNTSWAHQASSEAGIAFHQRIFNPGSVTDLTAVRFPSSGIPTVKLIPQSWSVDGSFSTGSAVSATAWVATYVYTPSSADLIIRIPLSTVAAIGDECSPTTAVISPATDGVASATWPDQLLPAT